MTKPDKPVKEKTRAQAFVDFIISRTETDNGLAAAVRRADNPDTEYRIWGLLSAFGIDIEKDWERRPYALIAAAVVKAGIRKDGTVPFLKALRNAYPDAKDSSGPGASRLRRLLSCETAEECCDVLRPMISLVLAKGGSRIAFADLLDDLYAYAFRKERVRLKWARAFYNKGDEQ